MSEPREYDLRADWEGLKRSTGILVRYPRWIVGATLAATVAGLLLALSSDPVYRAQTSLVLEDEHAKTPAVEELDLPSGTLEVEEAIRVVHSRDLVARVVADPEDGGLPTPDHPEHPRRLGLTTLVDELDATPLDRHLGDLTGHRSEDLRLFAAIDEVAPGAPHALRVRLLEGQRVELSRAHGDPEPRVHAYVEGEPLEYAGVRLRLAARGEWDARTWEVRKLPLDEAIDRTLAGLRVDKVPDHAGLVRLRVDDRDAARAADVANGLARAFLEHDLERVRARNARAVELVTGQLAEREGELRELEQEIARLQVLNPDVLEPGRTTQLLHERQDALTTRLADLGQQRRQLVAMAERLAAGEFAQASRIGADLDDPRTRKLLEFVTALEDELGRVHRDDNGDYQNNVELKRNDAYVEMLRIEDRAQALDDIVRKLERGEWDALGRLENEQAKDGAFHSSLLTRAFVDDYRQVTERLADLRVEFTEEYVEVRKARALEAELQAMILGELRESYQGMLRSRETAKQLVGFYDELLEERPERAERLIRDAREDLWAEIGASLAARVEGLAAEEDALALSLRLVQGRLESLPASEAALVAPRLAHDALAKTVLELTRVREAAEVAAAGTVATARLLDRATRPRNPIRPQAPFGAVVGGIAGVLASLGLAFLHERTRGRALDELDLERASGLPVLGSVPPRPARGLLSRGSDPSWVPLRDDPDGPVAGAYRALRARLTRMGEVGGRELRVLGVTSCLPGEGRSQTALALAMGLALEGRRTLLVDADLRAPDLARRLELRDAPGLAECLDGRRHWRQCVQQAYPGELDLLSAGEHYYSPADQLAGRALRELLEDALRFYDRVVLDLPQVVGLPDVECVASQLDGLVWVHSASRGPSRVLLARCADQLARGGARLLGVLHNAAPPASREERRVARRSAA